MAVFEIIKGDVRIQVQCNRCGRKSMFQHEATILTCNGCGNTFETEAPATVVVETVPPLQG